MTDTCHVWGSSSSEDRAGLQKPKGWGREEGDAQAENRATPTRRHHWKQSANTVRGTNPTEPAPEPGKRALLEDWLLRTGSLLLPLSQALPSIEGNCVSFIHPFIKDPASGIVSNRWNSRNKWFFFYRKPTVSMTSWDILGNKPITNLDTSSVFLLREGEDRTLIPAPIPLPLSLSVLRRASCRPSDFHIALFTVRQECCCCSAARSACLTPCDPVDCSTPGLPAHHHRPESAQVYVHWVGDAIQPSHPLPPPSPLAGMGTII